MRRALDVLFAVVAGVLVAPVALGVAGLIVAVMGRPVFFRQHRSGLHGAVFSVWKFRTMRAERWPGQPDAERIPRLGAFLRVTSLDELPQLWNILRGDMSLIGPRPTLPSQVAHYSPRQRGRLAVRPGLTGWAQVNGRNSLSWPHRIELDLWYIEHRSVRLEFEILLRTVMVLLLPRGVTAAGGTNPDFPVPAQRDTSPNPPELLSATGSRDGPARAGEINAPEIATCCGGRSGDSWASPPAQPPNRRTDFEDLEVSMHSYRRVLTRYWGLVVAGLIVGLTIAAAITFTTASTYTSQAVYLLSVPGRDDPSNAEDKARSYVKLLTLERVGDNVVRSLALNESAGEFTERVTARLDTNTMIVRALVTDDSPVGAQRIAEALSQQFVAIVAELEQPPGTAPGSVPGALTVRQVQPATLPVERTAPVTTLNFGLGAILGILAGIGLALVADRARGDEDGTAATTSGPPSDENLVGASAAPATSPAGTGDAELGTES